ncbi:WD40-repeat-containing domain protein [Melanogaster broomeanus]|nr:WD40-repeat-containing domain protein [Melanogaster broomeanus]
MSNTSKQSADLAPTPLVMISGHEYDITGIAYLPEGEQLVTCSTDKTVRIWNVESGEQEGTSMEHNGYVACLTVTRDGKRILSGGEEETIRIARSSYADNAIGVFDVESGELILGHIEGHEDIINCVIWSLDGSQLFSASFDHTIRCWNSETGEQIGQPWAGHTYWVNSLSLSPDGAKIASSSYDTTVRFWDAHSGDPIGQPLQHGSWVSAVALSPSGEFVASGGFDNTVSIWRVPWWGESQKQAPDCLLDLPAVPPPKGPSNHQQQAELSFLHLPTTCHPVVSSSHTTAIALRAQRLWRGLTAPRSAPSTTQQATQVRPIWRQHRFWKSTPVIQVAAAHLTDRVVVGGKPQQTQPHAGMPLSTFTTTKPVPNVVRALTHLDTSQAHSSAERSTSASKPGPSHPAGTSSHPAPAGRTSSFAPSPTASVDSFDDLDNCGKCLDYFCGRGPRPNRETFRPWRKKSRALIAEQRVKEEKKSAKAHRDRTTKPSRTPTSGHSLHQQDRWDHIKAASLASPNADDATPEQVGGTSQVGAADIQRVILQQQEEIQRLRQQLDDDAAARRQAEAERGARMALEMKTQNSGDHFHQLPEFQMHIRSPNTETSPSFSDHRTPERVRGSQVGAADPRHANLQLQEQLKQLRRQLDTEAAARQELEMKVNELQRTEQLFSSTEVIEDEHPYDPHNDLLVEEMSIGMGLCGTRMQIRHDGELKHPKESYCFRSASLVFTAHRSMDVSNEDEPVPFQRHTWPIRTVAYSPDGKQIATGADNGLIVIWHSKTGDMLRQLQGYTKPVYSVSFSHSGSRLVSGSQDTTLCIWDTTSGEPVGDKWEAHSDGVWAATYSPDDEMIASGGNDGLVRIWDAQRKMKIVEITDHPAAVYSVTFSPDGTCLATACADQSIRVLNVRTGALVLGPLAGHTSEARVVAYSADGMQLASGSFDNTIRTWDARTGILLLGPLEGHTDAVKHVEYSPDGKTLLSSSFDASIRLWDPVTGDLIAGPLRRHYGSVVARYFPEGDCFVSAGLDGSIRLWDTTTRDVILPLVCTFLSICPTIHKWIQMTEVGQLDYDITGPFRGHTGWVRGVAYFPDGMRVASASSDKSIRIWDVRTGVLVKKVAESDEVFSLSISSDGKRLVTGGFCSITMWDCITWQVMRRVPQGHSNEVWGVAFSPDASLIATAGEHGELFIWNSHTGEHVKTMSGHDPAMEVWTVTFSPDGQRIASGSEDRTIRIWDVYNAEAITGPLEGHRGGVTCVAFSPDGKTIASVSTDATLRLWDIELGNLSLAPIQHNSPVLAVSYSPDGKTICTGSEDGTICLLHPITGDLILGPLRGHRKDVSSIAFSPDGNHILTGSLDQTLNVWDSTTGEMIKFSESIRMEDRNLNALLDLPTVPLPSRTPRTVLAEGLTDPLDFLNTSRPTLGYSGPVLPAGQSQLRSPLAGLSSWLRAFPHRHSDNLLLNKGYLQLDHQKTFKIGCEQRPSL